jgi:hypothetical protein
MNLEQRLRKLAEEMADLLFQTDEAAKLAEHEARLARAEYRAVAKLDKALRGLRGHGALKLREHEHDER